MSGVLRGYRTVRRSPQEFRESLKALFKWAYISNGAVFARRSPGAVFHFAASFGTEAEAKEFDNNLASARFGFAKEEAPLGYRKTYKPLGAVIPRDDDMWLIHELSNDADLIEMDARMSIKRDETEPSDDYLLTMSDDEKTFWKAKWAKEKPQ